MDKTSEILQNHSILRESARVDTEFRAFKETEAYAIRNVLDLTKTMLTLLEEDDYIVPVSIRKCDTERFERGGINITKGQLQAITHAIEWGKTRGWFRETTDGYGKETIFNNTL